MKEKLQEKINNVYVFITNYINNNGFPPSVREICRSLKIKSTATVYDYISTLQNQGLLNKSPMKKRAISVADKNSQSSKIPLIGTVRAGLPLLAVENLEGYISIPSSFFDSHDEFALRVQGDSMINAGIYDKDIIIVKQTSTAENGEIVVALVEDSATVKRFYKEKDKIILHPENDEMQDLTYDNVIILGVVKGLMRKF